ncbi:MAG: hypothetical protein ACREBP_05295 [Sphingomicrobium sp.]
MVVKKTRKIPEDNELIVAEPVNSPALATDSLVDDDDPATLSIRATTVGDKLRDSSEKIAGQAADKARGLVAQGLERTAEALTNVSKMVEDTAGGIDERLGEEYGDYARKAAGALDKAAGSVSRKSPDELIDDTRTFVRNSPGMALAGAAVVGFVLARLIKSGLGSSEGKRD